MKITDIRVYFAQLEGRVKAYVNLVIDDCLVIRDLKIVQGKSRLFVAMPSKKVTDGSFRDLVYPVDEIARLHFETVILHAYEKAVKPV